MLTFLKQFSVSLAAALATCAAVVGLIGVVSLVGTFIQYLGKKLGPDADFIAGLVVFIGILTFLAWELIYGDS